MEKGITRRGFLAAAGALLVGCATNETKETTPKGTTIEQTDAGSKIVADETQRTLRHVKRTIHQCEASKKAIKQVAKNRCEEDIKFYRQDGTHCVSCTYTKEEIN